MVQMKENDLRRDVTVAICTLNEESNIGDCVLNLKQGFDGKIMVVDGNSDDKTVSIAENMGCQVVITKTRNISHQRNVAFRNCETEIICFFDADDRPGSKCISQMLKDLKNNQATGVMAISESFENKTYFQRAMDAACNSPKMISGPTIMVGQPSMFIRNIVENIEYDETFTCHEDTFISRSIIKAGGSLYVSSAINLRIHDSKFKDYYKKIKRYGIGDAMFVKKFPERYKSILFHLLINYPIKKSWYLIKNYKVQYIPFMLFMGFGRFYYMSKYLLTK